MSDGRSDNTGRAIGEIFRAMDTPKAERESAKLPRWTDGFPYVSGGLFSDNADTPKFSRIARPYLIHAGNLDWKAISIIQ